MKKVVCLHGFLGSKEDFKFLENKFLLFCPDLDPYISKGSIEELIFDIKNFKGDDPLFLVGYSFGSRLSTEILNSFSHLFEKVVLVAGHAGLKSVEEKNKRFEIEKNFIRAIDTKSFKDFCKYWNELDLFQFDEDIVPEEKTVDTMKSYFTFFGLSKQSYNLKTLKEIRNKIIWIYGAKDKKYSEYAKNELRDFNVSFIEKAGHRLLKNKDAQILIKKELANA